MTTKKEEITKQRIKIVRLKEQLKALKTEAKTRTMTLITSAFSFVAALFWRDAIQSLLTQTFGIKTGEGLWFIQMLVAIGVTLITIMIIFILSKTLGK